MSTHTTDDISTSIDSLSPAGQQRRDAMLADLQREVTARGRRRAGIRAAAAGAAGVAIILGGVITVRFVLAMTSTRSFDALPIADSIVVPPPVPTHHQSLPSSGGLAVAAAPLARPSRSVVTSVDTSGVSMIRPARPEGVLLERSRYRGQARVARADDGALAGALRASGRAMGVARTPSGVVLLPDVSQESDG